jgi:methyltransferase-like protein
MTNKKYAKAILNAVEKSVKGQPYKTKKTPHRKSKIDELIVKSCKYDCKSHQTLKPERD